MQYDHIKRSLLCDRCGPGKNKWKSIHNSVFLNKETGDIYCLVHREFKIGEVSMHKDLENIR